MNALLIDALSCSNLSRPPIWLMRQAGRYMPEYQALRKKHTLSELFHRPELAAKVTLLPIQLLDVDAAILFSDILLIAESLGFQVQFPDKGGPRIVPALRSLGQLSLLDVSCVLHYVFETISCAKEQLRVPLIGFCGGPFTVASYLIDSMSAQPFTCTRRWIAEKPQDFHRVLEIVTSATILFLKEQVRAGVDVIQVFDSWANALSLNEFKEYCTPYLQRIIESVKDLVPVIVFCRDASLRAVELSELKPSCISLDWKMPMEKLRSSIPSTIAVQGNIEPQLLKRPLKEIQSALEELLFPMRGEKGFIVNLGHGVLPDTPFEHVRYFVDMAKKLSASSSHES